jgi:AcrR family transcriptional regulator
MEQTTQTATPAGSAHVDGRTLRRTRNRTAVIAALLDLVRDGDMHPAAADIADRAGVSHRSIFRYFDDLDDLVHTTIDQALADAAPLIGIPGLGVGTLDERIASLVDARLALYASIDGAMQLARTRSYSIPSIDREISEFAQIFRHQVADHFATELAEHEDREYLIDAVVVLTGYEAYSVHLRRLGSDADRMRTAWTTGLAALLRR